MGPKKGRLAGLIAANENRSQSSQSNTTNITSNQPSNASNPPPNILVAVLDPNLPFSTAPAADLPQSQEIQSSVTNYNMDTSQNDNIDANTMNIELRNQQQNLLLQSNSNAVNMQGLVPQALEPGFQIHSTSEPMEEDVELE